MKIGPMELVVLFSVVIPAALIFYVIILLIRALQKYIHSGEVKKETLEVRKSIGEVLREHRTSLGMTQEFVAESLGVSRQAVSKWENGTSDPSTANLIAIGELFHIPADQLLREAAGKNE